MNQENKERNTLLFWLLILAILMSIGAFAQTSLKENENGVICTKVVKAKTKPIRTGYFFTDITGIVYPIYLSDGKYYVIHTNKRTGISYKHYVKPTSAIGAKKH